MSYLKHKPGSIEEIMANNAKKLNDNAYQDMFKKELEKAGKGIGSMSPKEKKDFFNKIDDKYKAKNEAVDNPYAVGMAAAMKAKNDKPPLKKSTITKAHDIAKSIEKDEDKELEEINNMISELGYGAKLQKVYVKRDGSDFNVFYRGRTKWGNNKQIGYFHRIPGGKLSVYHDNEDDEDDFTQNDLGYTVQKAIGIILDTADDNGVIKEDSQELQKDKTDNYKDKNKEAIKEAKYPHKMYSKDGKEVEAKTPDDHEKYAKMGYTHKNETHSFMTKDMNKSKKDAKGEKDIVDPKPKMSFKEAYKKAKKEAMNTVGDATADQANQLAGEGPKENDPDIKKPKAKADTGSKATPVDTSPEVEYKN